MDLIVTITVTYIGSLYILCLGGKYFRKKIVSLHLFVEGLIFIFFYGQILILWITEKPINHLMIPVLWLFIGHFFLECGFFSAQSIRMKSIGRIAVFVQSPSIILREIAFILFLSLLALVSFYLVFVPYGGPIGFILEGQISSRVALFEGSGYFLVLYGFLLTSNVMLFAVILFRKQSIRKRSRYCLYIFFVFHTFLMWVTSLPFGQRGGVITPMILWFLVYIYRKRKINFIILPLFLLIIIIGLVLLQVFREQESFSFIEQIDLLSAIISGYGGFFERLNTYSKVLEGIPELLDYQYGKTYITLFTQFVPRAIWPDKWDPAGYLITKNIMSDWIYSETSTYTQGTLFGEAFLNFSYFGLITVPFVFGFCINFIEKHYRGNYGISSSLKYSFWALTFLYILIGDFVNSMFWGLINMIIIIIFEYYSTAKITIKLS